MIVTVFKILRLGINPETIVTFKYIRHHHKYEQNYIYLK